MFINSILDEQSWINAKAKYFELDHSKKNTLNQITKMNYQAPFTCKGV